MTWSTRAWLLSQNPAVSADDLRELLDSLRGGPFSGQRFMPPEAGFRVRVYHKAHRDPQGDWVPGDEAWFYVEHEIPRWTLHSLRRKPGVFALVPFAAESDFRDARKQGLEPVAVIGAYHSTERGGTGWELGPPFYASTFEEAADELVRLHAARPSPNPSGYGPARPERIPTWVKPSARARAVAKKALERQAELPPSKRGGLTKAKAKKAGITSGIERARSIARGDLQPAEDLRDFFARFAGTHADAVAQGKAWEDSKVQQAWDLWGGDPMRADALAALNRASRPSRPENPGMSATWEDAVGLISATHARVHADPEPWTPYGLPVSVGVRRPHGPRTFDVWYQDRHGSSGHPATRVPLLRTQIPEEAVGFIVATLEQWKRVDPKRKRDAHGMASFETYAELMDTYLNLVEHPPTPTPENPTKRDRDPPPEALQVARDWLEARGYRWSVEHTPQNPWHLYVYVLPAAPGPIGHIYERISRDLEWRLQYWSSEKASMTGEDFDDPLEAAITLDARIREGKVYAYQRDARPGQPLATLVAPPSSPRPNPVTQADVEAFLDEQLAFEKGERYSPGDWPGLESSPAFIRLEQPGETFSLYQRIYRPSADQYLWERTGGPSTGSLGAYVATIYLPREVWELAFGRAAFPGVDRWPSDEPTHYIRYFSHFEEVLDALVALDAVFGGAPTKKAAAR